MKARARRLGPGPKRSRAANKAMRRRQIIDATIDSINTRGFAETTVAEVAKAAGVSQGMLMFHFKTKDALLVETLIFLSDEYRTAWQDALEAAGDDPMARILALVETDFSPKLCARKKVAVWYAFFGEAKSRPTYMTLCGAAEKERTKAMHELCVQALPAETDSIWNADTASASLERLGDGLWLQILLSSKRTERREALRVSYCQLLSIFPSRADMIRASMEKTLGDSA